MPESETVRRSEVDALIDAMPVLPATVANLLALDDAADSFFDDLIRTVETDPPAAVRLIGMVNSAAFRGAAPVRRVGDAVLRLGAARSRNLLVSASVAKVLPMGTTWAAELWTHGVVTASLARALALSGGNDRRVTRPHEAYLCGLLHDIGRFIMAGHKPELSDVDEADASAGILRAAEVATFGMDHAELGARTLRRWGLSSSVADAVARHHAPAEISPDAPGRRDVLLLRLADRLALEHAQRPTGLDGLGPQDAQNVLLPILTRGLASWSPVAPAPLVAIVQRTALDARLEVAMLGGR